MTAQWPGHAAEEVERLITVPIETELNGLPNLVVTRSVSLYGLSSIRVTFTDGTDLYFARQQVFERLRRREPARRRRARRRGAVLTVGPRLPIRDAELRSFARWSCTCCRTGCSTRRIRAVPGVADVASLGGETMQYQVLVDPTKLAGAGLVDQRRLGARSARTTATAAAASSPRAASSSTCADSVASSTLEDIGNIVLAVKNGVPVLDQGRRDRRDRARAAARPVRLQQAGRRRRRHHPHAHGRAGAGRAQARRGEDARAQRSRAAEGREGRSVLRPQRSRRAHDAHRVATICSRGIVLVVIVLIFFLYDVRVGPDRRGHGSAGAARSRSSVSTSAAFRRTCCRSARSTSAFSSTARS